MRETWYEISQYSESIEPIVVVGETELTITVEREFFGELTKRRQRKKNCYRNREDAVTALREILEYRVQSYKRELAWAEKVLEDFNNKESHESNS